MMKWLRISGLRSEENLDLCQKGCQNPGVPILLLVICTTLPNLSISGPLQIQELRAQRIEDVADSGNLDEESPVFQQTASNISAFEGQTVYLPCRVRNLGDYVVSWIRSTDLHILTFGDLAFSSDSRFSPQHAPGSEAWTLRLSQAKKSDSGKYECQINTEPKMMYAIQLSVRDYSKVDTHDEPYSQQTRISYESTAPVAAITGPREQRVAAGSTITLRCIITSPYQTRPIRGVQWLRDNKLVTFQAARGGINVETEKGATQTISEVTIAGVTQNDMGKYSCRPTEGQTDTVMLIVEQGERIEAMQRDANYISSASKTRYWSSVSVTLLQCFISMLYCVIVNL